MLSKDQRKFDRNGDGRLSGFEWQDWYDYNYAIDETDRENREIDTIEAGWDQWYSKVSAILNEAYSNILISAEALLPDNCTDTKALTEKTFFNWITTGLLAGHNWKIVWRSGGGIYTSGSLLFPYQSLVRGLTERHPGVCTFNSVAQAMAAGKPLFENEGILTNRRTGEFWVQLLNALPAYHDLPLAIFDCHVRIAYPNKQDDDKIRLLQRLLESLFPMFTYFSGRPDEERTQKLAQYRECFEYHWCALSGNKPVTENEPKVDSSEYGSRDELLDVFSGCFPSFDPENEQDRAAFRKMQTTDLLLSASKAEPESIAELMEYLLENTVHDGGENDFCHLDESFSELFTQGDTALLLDELEDNDETLEEIFDSPYMVNTQQCIYDACIAQQRTQLLTRLYRSGKVEQKNADKPAIEASEYIYCHVKLKNIKRSCAYLTDDATIKPGDFVSVPFGRDNTVLTGQIVQVERCTAENAPFPPARTKHILGKISRPQD